MRTYIRLLGSGASVLIGLGATMIVQGGWQAVVAAFAIFGGLVFAMSFISLGVRAERPRSRRPGWAVGGSEPRGVHASAEGDRAARSTPHPARRLAHALIEHETLDEAEALAAAHVPAARNGFVSAASEVRG